MKQVLLPGLYVVFAGSLLIGVSTGSAGEVDEHPQLASIEKAGDTSLKAAGMLAEQTTQHQCFQNPRFQQRASKKKSQPLPAGE